MRITRTAEDVALWLDVARRTRDWEDGAEITALDPAEMDTPILLVDGLELLDGCHRLLGIARWAEEHGVDLEDEAVEISALHVPRAVVDAEHPEGSTPEWLVAEWTARAK